MFGNLKSKIALAAVVAVGAVAMPAAAQAAPHWTVNGVTIPTSPQTAITGDGTLTLNAAAGFKVTCGVHVTADIWNDASGVGKNSITSVTFSNPCSTNVPGCTATAAALGLPWPSTLTAVGAVIRDSITGVSFTNTFAGTCPTGVPIGVPISETGVLGPIVGAGGLLTFDGGTANTVSGPLGSATVTGTVTVTSPTGVSAAL